MTLARRGQKTKVWCEFRGMMMIIEGESKKKSAQAQILDINKKSAIFAQSSTNFGNITYS